MGEVVVVVGGEGRRRCSCFCSYFVVHILVLLLCLDALFYLDGGVICLVIVLFVNRAIYFYCIGVILLAVRVPVYRVEYLCDKWGDRLETHSRTYTLYTHR